MEDRQRNHSGKFLPKSNELRQVRSIRLTDSTWEFLGQLAESQNISRADVLEDLADNTTLEPRNTWQDKVNQLQDENEKLKQELENAKSSALLEKEYLQEIRDRVLFGLKIGKQAPEYKRTLKALDRFIDELLN